jgi:hypothetical protein
MSTSLAWQRSIITSAYLSRTVPSEERISKGGGPHQKLIFRTVRTRRSASILPRLRIMPSPYPRDVRHSPRSSAARRQTRSVGKAGSHSSTSDHPRAPSRTDPRFGAPCQRKQPQTALSSSLLLRPSRLAPKRKSLARTARPHCQVRGPLGRHRQAGSPRALRQPRPAGAVGRAKAFSAGAVVDHGPRSRDGCAAGIGYERERGSRQQGRDVAGGGATRPATYLCCRPSSRAPAAASPSPSATLPRMKETGSGFGDGDGTGQRRAAAVPARVQYRLQSATPLGIGSDSGCGCVDGQQDRPTA